MKIGMVTHPQRFDILEEGACLTYCCVRRKLSTRERERERERLNPVALSVQSLAAGMGGLIWLYLIQPPHIGTGSLIASKPLEW
jgi:hypothetical protein